MRTLGWGALAAVFGGLAWIVLSESLLRPHQELLYRLSPSFAQCFKKASGEICAAGYRLAIANSGDERQELVQVRWPAAFSGWLVDWSASDLIASARARANPLVRAAAGGELRHEVQGLEPNTLLEFRVSCDGCSRAQIEAASKAAVLIDGRGRILETEPRTTIFGRALTNAARLAAILF
jgi:hypothetical protein